MLSALVCVELWQFPPVKRDVFYNYYNVGFCQPEMRGGDSPDSPHEAVANFSFIVGFKSGEASLVRVTYNELYSS